ncbi:MAG: transglutaminase-like domain-containing protein, partial [Candidatus Nealsonbacteria bacterium]
MNCPECKRRIFKDDKFCGHCGSITNFKEEKNNYPKVSDEYRIEHIDYPTKQDRQKRHTNIINVFCNNWKPVLFIGIALLILWSIVSDGGFGIREFPQLTEPKNITFEWEYKGSKYVIRETLYKTVYDYYHSDPDKDCSQESSGYEDCLKSFLEEAEGDNTISKIASDIKAVALKNGLRGDELIELTVAFVQSIPYDENKLKLVTYPNKIEDVYPVYPYEVLYNNKGVCAGKSFLTASLIRELGYGTALFDYDPIIEGEVGHIAAAVKCPKGYSSYNSGYCYIETVETGFKIGDIPINIDAGIPKTRTTIKLFGEENVFDFDELKDAEIHIMADGNSYQGIIDTVQTMRKIENLESEITRLYWVITSLDEEANQLENSANYYEQQSEAAYERHSILR